MNNKVLIAIGGGEIGRVKTLPDGSIRQCPVETMAIDQEIIKYTNKTNPSLLVVGTASHDNDGYFEVVKKHFTQRLSCKVNRLDITNNDYSTEEIDSMVSSTDIVYIGGGDTRYMIKKWKELGIDKSLITAYNNGVVIAGCSAGAICWFDYYDNFDYKDEEGFKPELLEGLGIIKGLAVPHFDKVSEEDKKVLSDLFSNKEGNFYGIDNCSAIIYENDIIKFISSKDNKKVCIMK